MVGLGFDGSITIVSGVLELVPAKMAKINSVGFRFSSDLFIISYLICGKQIYTDKTNFGSVLGLIRICLK